MTNQEKVIVSAYTGYLMCEFSDMHEYVEKVMGRPVFTHEMGGSNFNDLLRERVKHDFLAICGEEMTENSHAVPDSHRADHYNQLSDIARLEQEKAALELENALLRSQVERLKKCLK